MFYRKAFPKNVANYTGKQLRCIPLPVGFLWFFRYFSEQFAYRKLLEECLLILRRVIFSEFYCRFLTRFRQMFSSYTLFPTFSGFLTFSGGIEIEQWYWSYSILTFSIFIIYIYIYIYIYIHMYVFMYLCMYLCMYNLGLQQP